MINIPPKPKASYLTKIGLPFAFMFSISCFNVLLFCSCAFWVVAVWASTNEVIEWIVAALLDGCEMIDCSSCRYSTVVTGVVISSEYSKSNLSPTWCWSVTFNLIHILFNHILQEPWVLKHRERLNVKNHSLSLNPFGFALSNGRVIGYSA